MDREQEAQQREEERRQAKEARQREKEEAREARLQMIQERRAREDAERELARQRQLGVAKIAFKAGFFGALGVALASPVIVIITAIFWVLVIGFVQGFFSGL